MQNNLLTSEVVKNSVGETLNIFDEKGNSAFIFIEKVDKNGWWFTNIEKLITVWCGWVENFPYKIFYK